MQNNIKVILLVFVESPSTSKRITEVDGAVRHVIEDNMSYFVEHINVRGTMLLERLVELGFYTKQDIMYLQVCITTIIVHRIPVSCMCLLLDY